MPKVRVRYTPAFKEKAIRMITVDGRRLTSAASELGIPNSVLSKWVKQSRDAARPGLKKGRRETDMLQLEQRIERLEKSLEILRKIVRGDLLVKVKSEFPDAEPLT